MGLDVIGVGFGRTGTESMKRALERLGYGPCYHMFEVMPHKDRYAHWLSVFNDGADPDWDATFEGYRATVDWPAAACWRELADHYPDAKILLTVRSSDSWYASMEKTILPAMHEEEAEMAQAIKRFSFGNTVEDRDHVIGVYERHNAQVQAAFDSDRLLTYELGSGWQPLCDFLGAPVPGEDYPRGNHTEAFHETAAALTGIRTGQSPTPAD